jgi:hypothetical protein
MQMLPYEGGVLYKYFLQMQVALILTLFCTYRVVLMFLTYAYCRNY